MSSSFRRAPRSIEPPKKPKTGLIVGLIIGAIIIIIVIVIVILLLRRRAAAVAEDDEVVPGITCQSDADCPKQCNTVTGLCVECLDDSACTGTLPRCKGTLNKCVECLEKADCTVDEICSADQCCDLRAPVITSVTPEITADFRYQATINYDYFQGGNAKVYIVLMDPVDGAPLGQEVCVSKPDVTCTAHGDCEPGEACIGGACKILGCLSQPLNGTAILLNGTMPFELYPNEDYLVKIKAVYSCGTLINESTEYSNTVFFSMPPPCDFLPRFQIMGVEDETGEFGAGHAGLTLIIVFFLGGIPGDFKSDILVLNAPVTNISQLHPNKWVAFPDVQWTTHPSSSVRKIARIPYPPEAGNYSFRLRLKRNNGFYIGDCDGEAGGEPCTICYYTYNP